MTGPVSFPNDRIIQREEELLDLFSLGCKPREAWGVGLEYERFGLDSATGRAIPYSGAHGVESALRELAERFGWSLEEESGRIIGLSREGSLISLEPGGQVELSARVHRDLATLREELKRYLEETASVAGSHGFVWVPMGLQPVSRIEEIEWVPKGRYAIMAPFLGARGGLAHHMMKGTAGCQLNLDYASEEDAAEKLRTAMGITSIVTAAFANSPLYQSELNGFMSRRAHIWLDTDPARCGLPELAFRDGLTFRDYLYYALDVPVIFVRRIDRWIALDGVPFRRFLREGHRGIRATLADWVLHLTTIFTEVRLKSYIEVRGADSVEPSMALALTALWKGILYDGKACRDAWNLVAGVPYRRRLAFHSDACALGPAARSGGETARELASELVRIARGGLERSRRLEAGVRSPMPEAGEETFLLPLERSLGSEAGCPGAELTRAWGTWMERDPRHLVEIAARAERAFTGEPAGPS